MLRKLDKVEGLSVEERILFARSLAATPDERVQHCGARNADTRGRALQHASRVLDFRKLRHERQRMRVSQHTQARAIDSVAS